MVPLNEIKPNSSKIKKRDGNTVISPADPDQKTALALSDHVYCKTALFDQNIIHIDNTKIKNINFYINKLTNNSNDNTSGKKFVLSKTKNLTSIFPNYIEITNVFSVYDGLKDNTLYTIIREQVANGVVNIDISNRVTPKPSGVSYINLKQNTNEWHEYRKHKITAS